MLCMNARPLCAGHSYCLGVVMSDVCLTASRLCAWRAQEQQQQQWLAVGLWTEDTVHLQRVCDDEPMCSLDCSDVGQPRSILTAKMHGTWFLFVGTSQGWVVFHALTWESGTLANTIIHCSGCAFPQQIQLHRCAGFAFARLPSHQPV